MSRTRWFTRETVLANDVSTRVNPGSLGEVGVREVNRGENASAQQKAIGATVGGAHIRSDNVARRIDVIGHGRGGAGNINRSERGVRREITGSNSGCEKHSCEYV